MGNENKAYTENGKWHIDRRVSVGHIITTLTIVVGFMFWIMSLETAVALNTTKIENTTISIQRLDNNMNKQYAEIIRRLERLDDKVSSHQELSGGR